MPKKVIKKTIKKTTKKAPSKKEPALKVAEKKTKKPKTTVITKKTSKTQKAKNVEKPEKTGSYAKSRADWEANHITIRNAYVELIRRYQRKPTLKEVSKDTKLSMKTIERHLKEIKFKPLEHPLRVLTDDVLISIGEQARKGKFFQQKLWLQVMEGWAEDQNINLNAQDALLQSIAAMNRDIEAKKAQEGN